MYNRLSLTIMISLIILTSCAAPGPTAMDKRNYILKMRARVLKDLYRLHPAAQAKIKRAPGYAVFSNRNVNIIFVSAANGYGVVHDNKTGRDTYMRMAEVGLGLGLGAKDFRAVFVFHDRKTLNRFINSGWEFGAHADAAAKAGQDGAAVGGEILIDGITIYQLTESGLALQATVKGTKYWRDDDLNHI